MQTQQDIFANYFGPRDTSGVTTEIVNTPVMDNTIPNVSNGQRADGNIDIYGFAEKVAELLTSAWEDDWGTFTINGTKKDNIDSINLPMIVFDVIERQPSRNKIGIKARAMEMHVDPDDNDYSIIIHRKWFDIVVEFLVLDASNQEAIKTADRFELFIDTFTGFFKETGVSELIFYKEVDSRLSKNYIEGVASRAIRYSMVIERIVVERVRTTKEVRSEIQATSLNRG